MGPSKSRGSREVIDTELPLVGRERISRNTVEMQARCCSSCAALGTLRHVVSPFRCRVFDPYRLGP